MLDVTVFSVRSDFRQGPPLANNKNCGICATPCAWPLPSLVPEVLNMWRSYVAGPAMPPPACWRLRWVQRTGGEGAIATFEVFCSRAAVGAWHTCWRHAAVGRGGVRCSCMQGMLLVDACRACRCWHVLTGNARGGSLQGVLLPQACRVCHCRCMLAGCAVGTCLRGHC
jgi:hypothetical protein